jgi:predicted flap endonuclease-1-like 5' DNA nuclease
MGMHQANKREFWTRGPGVAVLQEQVAKGKTLAPDVGSESWARTQGRTFLAKCNQEAQQELDAEAVAAQQAIEEGERKAAQEDADVSTIKGVGEKSAEKLKEAGIMTVGQVKETSEEDLLAAGLSKLVVDKILKAVA